MNEPTVEPLVAGGQLRSDEDLQNDASNGSRCFWLALIVLVIAFGVPTITGCSADMRGRIIPKGY